MNIFLSSKIKIPPTCKNEHTWIDCPFRFYCHGADALNPFLYNKIYTSYSLNHLFSSSENHNTLCSVNIHTRTTFSIFFNFKFERKNMAFHDWYLFLPINDTRNKHAAKIVMYDRAWFFCSNVPMQNVCVYNVYLMCFIYVVFIYILRNSPGAATHSNDRRRSHFASKFSNRKVSGSRIW